jgi:hypothetical protein
VVRGASVACYTAPMTDLDERVMDLIGGAR